MYNAWGSHGAFLAVATTKDPTHGPGGWIRHGPVFPEHAKLDGWPGKSGSIVSMPAPGPHFLIWSCARALRITPSVGRSMVEWDGNRTEILFQVRKPPYWDTGFVESAMPPLKLSDGNLLFFYDSVGPWNGTSGFQPGWAVLSGTDPTQVLARAEVPPLPYVLPWEAGVRPQWPCNTRHVSNLGGGHPVAGPNPLGPGDDLFRVYFGGADAVVGTALVSVQLAPTANNFTCTPSGAPGLAQCRVDHSGNATFRSFVACEAACPAPVPPPPKPTPMVSGVLYPNTDITGDNLGSDGAAKGWEQCRTACIARAGCVAFTFDNRTACPEGPCCWFKGPNPQPAHSVRRLSMLLRKTGAPATLRNGVADAAAAIALLWVHGENVSLAVDSMIGGLAAVNCSTTGWNRRLDPQLSTSFATDDPSGVMNVVSVEVTAVGASVVTRRLVTVQGYGTAAMQRFNATITDVFAPDAVTGGVVWNTTVDTESSQPWRAAIGTRLRAPAGQPLHPGFWLARNGNGSDDVLGMQGAAAPPLQAQLGDGFLDGASESSWPQMPYPLFLWAAGVNDTHRGGLVVAPSLADTTLGASAQLNSSDLLYKRVYNRLSSAASVSFATHIGALRLEDPFATTVDPRISGDDAWRDALRITTAVNPQVFTSVAPMTTPAGQPTTLADVGLGIYTCSDPTDVNVSTTVYGAGATVLWDASFWWPYIGLFLPPVANSTAVWSSNSGGSEEQSCSRHPGGFAHGGPVTAAEVGRHLDGMSEIGVTVPLSYFNLFEMGENVKWPLPPADPDCAATAAVSPTSPVRCWNDSSLFIASHFNESVVFVGDRRVPSYTWQNAIVLDPGTPAYRKFLVEQTQRHFDLLGRSFHGVVIDRTDHTSKFSRGRDDGVAWCGGACTSMLPAWIGAAKEVSAVLHAGAPAGTLPGQVPIMLVNYAGSTRADLLTHADGIFSESGDGILNSIGLSTIAMPAVAWTYSATEVTDATMQRHLRMGVFPMAPVYGADHSIDDSSAAANALYTDYGPLFRSIKAARWGLDRSHVISVDPPPASGGPRHNVFESLTPKSSPAPWIVVLTAADTTVDTAIVTLKLPFGCHAAGCEVQLPGIQGTEEPLFVFDPEHRTKSQECLLKLQTRLFRGCAVLLCSLE